MAAAAPVRLADYTAWAFQLPTIQLNVNVQDTFVLVEARMELLPQASAGPLALRGVELDLLRVAVDGRDCLLYTSPSPRDLSTSRMPSSA